MLIVVGVIVGILGVVLYSLAFSRVTNGEALAPPGVLAVDLAPGEQSIYEQAATTSVRPADVDVTGPDGAAIPVRADASLVTISSNHDVYARVGTFRAPTAGTYQLKVKVGGGPITVGRDLSSNGRTMVIGLALGILAVVGGVALLRRAATAAPRDV